LHTTAAVGAGYWAAGGVTLAQSTSPNEQIQFASVGVGGKGASDSFDAFKSGKTVAICDVDESTLGKAALKYKNPQTFYDFRKMLEVMGDKIDAVTVSIPDHCHAAVAAMAMKLGKHCFVQKPMTHSIWEARQLREIAKETGVATMMGNQGTANDGLRQAAHLLKTGHIGKVSEVHVWTNRPVWPQGIERPASQPIPNSLHWYEWLGPAADRPYNEAYHPFKWRGFWDFGTGALGDMACHTVNMPYMGLDLRDPISVEAETPGHNKETYPSKAKITFQFPERNGRAALKFMWYDGGQFPPQELFEGANHSRSETGALVVGDKGKIFSWGDYGEQFEVFGGATRPASIEFEKSPGHFEEWVRAIKGGPKATSNFVDYAGPLTETILLGNLAVWSGEKVDWDAETMTAKNKPELAAIVKPEYRAGYSL
jgi:predicted dehydrogenase